MLHLALPASCRPWLPALAWYLRQNLLIFLHSPKYTDSNSRNHFQVRFQSLPCTDAPTHPLAVVTVFYRCHVLTFARGPVYTHASPTPCTFIVFLCSRVCLSAIPHCGHHPLMASVHPLSLSALCLSPQHPLPPQGGLPDLDIYLYNKPGGQGTGGKGTRQACATADCGKAFLVLWLTGPFPALQLRAIQRGRQDVWRSQT